MHVSEWTCVIASDIGRPHPTAHSVRPSKGWLLIKFLISITEASCSVRKEAAAGIDQSFKIKANRHVPLLKPKALRVSTARHSSGLSINAWFSDIDQVKQSRPNAKPCRPA